MPGYASFAVDLPDQQTLEGMLCVFAKETFVANLLEVQETKCSFSTAERNRKSFRWTQVREWKACHHYQRWMAFRKLSHHVTMMEETLCVIATSVIIILMLTSTWHVIWLTKFLRAFLLVHVYPSCTPATTLNQLLL